MQNAKTFTFFCCQNLCENETRCLWLCTFSQTPLSPLTVTQVGALNKTGKFSEGPLLPPPFPKHPDTNNQSAVHWSGAQRKCPQELYIFFWPLVDQAGLNTFSHYFSDTTPTYCELFYLWLSDLKLLHVWSKRFKGVPLFWQRTPPDYNLHRPLFSLISKEWDVLTLWNIADITDWSSLGTVGAPQIIRAADCLCCFLPQKHQPLPVLASLLKRNLACSCRPFCQTQLLNTCTNKDLGCRWECSCRCRPYWC